MVAERPDEIDPEEIHEHRRLRAEVQGVWSKTAPRHRRVLGLRDLDGLPYAEVASEMGVSVKAVEALLAGARRKFRARYEGAA